MHVVIHRKQDYINVLGIYNSKYEAIGKAYEFLTEIINSYTSCKMKYQCDMLLHNIEPNGKEFKIIRDNIITHIQILNY